MTTAPCLKHKGLSRGQPYLIAIDDGLTHGKRHATWSHLTCSINYDDGGYITDAIVTERVYERKLCSISIIAAMLDMLGHYRHDCLYGYIRQRTRDRVAFKTIA